MGHFWLNCFTYKYTPYFWHELSGLKLFVIYVGIKYLFKWLWYILPQVIFIHIYDVYNYYILDLRVKNMGFKPQISTLFWVKIKNLLTTDVLPRNELIKCSIKSSCQKRPFSSNFYCMSRVGQFLTKYSTSTGRRTSKTTKKAKFCNFFGSTWNFETNIYVVHLSKTNSSW